MNSLSLENKTFGKRGIVVNRMFVGDYLTHNLGHEIINLFQADNGCHYLYLNASGSFSKEHSDIGYMLMVKSGPKDCFEIIGLATGLEPIAGVDEPRKKDIKDFNETINQKQLDFIASQPGGDIKYGGISLIDLFNEAEQQSVFITFKADKVFVPKGNLKLFLHYDKSGNNESIGNERYFAIKQHNQPKTSLKSYLDDTSADQQNLIDNLINNTDLWASKESWKVGVDNASYNRPVSIFDICKIQNDENRISNALAYFMSRQEYKGLWQEFFNRFHIKLLESFSVEREVSAKIEDSDSNSGRIPNGGRIDLFIRDNDNIIVIENKIKSDINSISSDKEDTNQLDRYYNFVFWLMESKFPNTRRPQPHFLILAPDYNIPVLSDNVKDIYKILTYKNLYDFLMEKNVKEIIEKDTNFVAFRDVIFRHTFSNQNEYLYYEMLEKFNNRIDELRLTPSQTPSISIDVQNNRNHTFQIESENKIDNTTIINDLKIKKMAIKSAIAGEFIITQEDNGSIRVCQIFDNVKDSLREASKSVGFKFDPNWNTRQFGKNLVNEYGDGSGQTANVGEYTIVIRDSGSVESYRVHGNTIAALRKIASENDFKADTTWNTRILGSKLIDFVNGDYNPEEEIEEIAFVVKPEMSVKELQDNFKEMFGGHLRIKNGNRRCDEYYDESKGQQREALDVNLSEIGCSAEGRFSVDMTVGEFQDKVKSDCGLSVVVATVDDWVAVLPEFTLDGVNLIPKNTTKAKMQEILAR